MTLTDIRIIDTDSHVMEPPDLWTSRMSEKKWGTRIPHLVLDERRDEMRWLIGGKWLTGVANWATAGWHEHPPSHPRTLEEAEPGAWNPEARLERMTEFGIWAQALYPNLLTFSGHAFQAMGDDDLIIESIQAYNDFLIDCDDDDGGATQCDGIRRGPVLRSPNSPIFVIPFSRSQFARLEN